MWGPSGAPGEEPDPVVDLLQDRAGLRAGPHRARREEGLGSAEAASCGADMQRGPPPVVSRVDGGATVNDTLMQFQADTISRKVARYLHSEGIDATMHQLRHTFGTELYRNTRDLLATRDLMADLRAADPFRQGGGKLFGKADRSRFLDVLDRVLRAAAAG